MVDGARSRSGSTPSPSTPAKQISEPSDDHKRKTASTAYLTPRKYNNASVRIRRGSIGVQDKKKDNSIRDKRSRPTLETLTNGADPKSTISSNEIAELSVRREELYKRHAEKVLAEREAADGSVDSDDEEPGSAGGNTPGAVPIFDPLDPDQTLKARNEAVLKEKKAEKARLLMEREVTAVKAAAKDKKRTRFSSLLHPRSNQESGDSSDDDELDDGRCKRRTPVNEKHVELDSTTGLNELPRETRKAKKKRYAKMPKWRKSKTRASVMETLALRNQKALDRRDEERKATRASRFHESNPSQSRDSGDLERQADQEDHQDEDDAEFENDEIVDTLEVVDPGISAVTHLSNIANSIIFPPIPSLYSRAPVINIPLVEESESRASTDGSTTDTSGYSTAGATPNEVEAPEALTKSKTELAKISPPPPKNLDEHVKEVLRKRDMIKRGLKGVWAFMKTPLGVIATIYGFLVVFFGAG